MNSGPTIGVLSPLVGGFYFGGLLAGINAAARLHGGTVLAVQTFDAGVEHTDYGRPPRFAERIGWQHADGYVVVVNAIGDGDLPALVETGKPVVLISNRSDVGCPIVTPDNQGGVEQAVDHLIEHGHSRIGFAGALTLSDMGERFDAYVAALTKHGLTFDSALHYEVDDSYERGGRQAGMAMLAAGVPSTAVVAATDRNAIGIMQVLTEAGLTLPDDQAIIGFDDTEAAQHASPRLTSIRQDFADVGRTAVELVLMQLRGQPVQAGLHRVPAALIVRQSCGCGRVGTTTESRSGPAKPEEARAQLARSVHAAVRRLSEQPGTEPGTVDAALAVIDSQLSAAVTGGRQLPPAEVQAAMLALCQLNPSVDAVEGVLAAVHDFAKALRSGTDSASALRTEEAANSLATAIRDGQFQERYRETAYFRDAFNTQYAVSLALLTEREGQEYDLGWLNQTGASAGALGVWNDARSALDTVGVFDAMEELTASECGRTLVERFPPQQLMRAAQARDNQIVFAIPVRAGHNDWGWLCVVGPMEANAYIGRDKINQWAALLTVALEVAAKGREVADLGRELAAMLESSPDAVARYDAELRYQYLNPAAAATLGEDDEQIIGRTDRELRRHPDVWVDALEQVVQSVTETELDFSETKSDETRWYQARMVPLVDADGLLVGVLSSSRDISALKRAEHDLAYQALHDSLTGLANRVLFLDRLSSSITRLERLPGTLAVLFIDLDRFKEVNDNLGHDIGDRLLVQVAHRIQALSRRSDTLSRFGGDEFVLLCDRLADDEDIRIIGDRLVRTLAAPFYEDGHELVVSASIGIVVVSDPYVDVSTVIRNADQAMYSAKERGRDRFHVFDADLRERTTARHSMEVDLRHALERNEFRLVYQPLFTLSTGAIIGVEALLRWHHPTRGIVQPADFIGLAEQRGLMVAIGAWVLDEAFRQLGEWSQRDKLATLGLAVNVSGKQLTDPAIVSLVEEALVRHHIDPARVTLEITETTLIEEGTAIRDTLMALRALGVLLALDDFGTGYSSLVHIRDFPVSTLKIDRSFVEQLGSGNRANEIIGALTAMAHFLDMTVVGEGIERQSEWDELRALGCDDGQGFLVARPLAPADIVKLLDVTPGDKL